MAKAKKEPRRAIAVGQTAMSVLPPTVEAIQLAQGFSATINGLEITGTPPIDRWSTVGTALRVLERSSQFAIGDFLNAIEELLGEASAQVVDYSEGWSEKTCAIYKWLAARVPKEVRRMDRLGIRHHLLVAALTPAKQKQWLTKAAADNEEKPWTVKRLQDALKEGEDLPPAAYWVLVGANSVDDQLALQGQLEAQGRTCKALVRRERRKDN